MKGFELVDQEENRTIALQKRRGNGETYPFGTREFREVNQIVLDVTYMLEKSVSISGYLSGHNPFVQPGVEAYKRAMFALIGKPGFEKEAQQMEKQLKGMKRIRI